MEIKTREQWDALLALVASKVADLSAQHHALSQRMYWTAELHRTLSLMWPRHYQQSPEELDRLADNMRSILSRLEELAASPP